MPGIIRTLDRDALREQYRLARPFPFIQIDNFLESSVLADVIAAYPTYESARKDGFEFDAVNEKMKIQVTDSSKFPAPVKAMSDALHSREFLNDLQYITGISDLLDDPLLEGGGMHLTSSSGLLDVHVDFNYLEKRDMHRRLNILVYLNPVWNDEWGGRIELWNKDVSKCEQSFSPIQNRCVIFETSEISYHGVTQIKCPPGFVRKSFAAYYYTKEPPASWDGRMHSTVFRARPDELLKGAVLMPTERLKRSVLTTLRKFKSMLKGSP